MMELVLNQEDIDLLVPLAIEEILIRLLRSPSGVSIAQIGIPDSHAQKISKAISWLKSHYTESLKVEDMANVAGMSISSFHNHFKKITSMSPVKFQKTLRLQEARNLMLIKMFEVSQAAMQVGYISVSQFSRDYKSLFGHSPSKDIAKI